MDWRRVILSDETNRFGSDGLNWCWKTVEAAIQLPNVFPILEHLGGSIMLWYCITASGPGFMRNIMDSDLYCKILRGKLIRTIRYYRLDPVTTIFQQDNDSKNTYREAKDYIDDLRILEWPEEFPDLNPIEHIWILLESMRKSQAR